MASNKFVKETGMPTTLASIVVFIFGLLLIIWPNTIIKMLFQFVGIVLLGLGAYNIISYVVKKDGMQGINWRLYNGILFLLGGIGSICFRGVLMDILPFAIGVIAVLGGIAKLQCAFNVRRLHASNWFIPLITAVISVVMGALLMFNAHFIITNGIRFIGIVMSIESVEDFIAIGTYNKALGGGYMKK